MSIDVAIPGDRNVIKKEDEKILKCKDLIIEIQRVWNVKAKVIPVIIMAAGTILKSLRQYLSNIPGKYEFNKNSRIEHCSHATENTNVKAQNTFRRHSDIICSTNCEYNITYLRDVVCFRYLIVNTLHKSDNKDNNNNNNNNSSVRTGGDSILLRC
jgi:hypothetical protein